MTRRILLTAVAATVLMAARMAPSPDLAVIGSVKAPDGRWDFATVIPASHTLYVARGDGVMAVDLPTGKVTPTLVPGQHVHAVVPLPGGTLLSTNGDSDTVTIADAKTGHVIATAPTGKGPDAAVFDPSSGLVLVMGEDTGDVTLIDPKTGASPGHIALGTPLEVAVADGHGRAYVNLSSANAIAVVDTHARRVVARYPLTGCEHPTGLALDPASFVLLSSCGNGQAVAMRAADGKIVATLPIGRGPDTVIFDAKRHAFFIPCGRDGTLVEVAAHGAVLAVAATIPTAPGARTGALDPGTGDIYLPAANVSKTAAGYHIEPGSFRIVVVGDKVSSAQR